MQTELLRKSLLARASYLAFAASFISVTAAAAQTSASDTATSGSATSNPAATSQAPFAPTRPDTSRPQHGSAPSGLETVVVTAEKRGENVQNVPLSITAASDKTLQAANVTTVSDLARVAPGFNFGQQLQTNAVSLHIRGIGTGGQTAIDPSVATFQDDVYIPRPGAIIGSFFDVNRIEVLRGPQGTLFGRNASAGAISIHSNDPTDEFGGYINAEVGDFGTRDIEAAINVPIDDDLSVRAAGLISGHDGLAFTTYGNHRYDTRRTGAARVTARYAPGDGKLTWLVRANYEKIGGDGNPQWELNPATLTPTTIANLTGKVGAAHLPDLTNLYDRRSFDRIVGKVDDPQWGITSDLSYAFSGDYTLRLIDSVNYWQDHELDGDIFALPLNILQRRGVFESQSQSHELQFVSPKHALLNGKLDFVSGLYFFDERLKAGEIFDIGPDYCGVFIPFAKASLQPACLSGSQIGASVGTFNQGAQSVAAYGQATYAILDNLDFTAGLRWTNDSKSGFFNETVANQALSLLRVPESVALKYGHNSLTYRFNLAYHPLENALLFATYSTGYKSGGFNSGFGATVLNQRRIFNPENVQNYELGGKAQFFNDTLSLDATLFRDFVVGLQDRSFDGISAVIVNAGNLQQQGVDSAISWLATDHLQFALSSEYLESRFSYYPFAGNLPAFAGTQNLAGKSANYSPRWQGNLSAQYDDVIGTSDWSYSFRVDDNLVSSENVGSATDGNPQTVQPQFQLVSGRFTIYAPNNLSFGIFATNIMNAHYCGYFTAQVADGLLGLRNPGNGGTAERCVPGDPRIGGIQASYKF